MIHSKTFIISLCLSPFLLTCPSLGADVMTGLEHLRQWQGGTNWQMQGRLSWRSSMSNPFASRALPGDSLSMGRLDLHNGRLLLGAQGHWPSAGLRWSLLGGGTFAENRLYEQRILTPEGRIALGYRATPWLDLNLFSRYGWSQANVFATDSLRRKDWVSGLAILAESPRDFPLDGDLQLQLGNRRSYVEHEEANHLFGRAELNLRAGPRLNLRFYGESQGYGRDSLDFLLQRNLGGIDLRGELLWGIQQAGSIERRYREGNTRWLVNESLWAQPFVQHRFDLRVNTDWSDWQDQRLLHRWLRGSWSWLPTDWIGSRLQFKENWIEIDDQPGNQDRSVTVGPWFRLKPLDGLRASGSGMLSTFIQNVRQSSFDGNLDLGMKESGMWGTGATALSTADLLVPLQFSSWFSPRLQDQFSMEALLLNDPDDLQERLGVVDPEKMQTEINNRLSLSMETGPYHGLRVGHRVHWQRQLGSELVFPLDTLRNTTGNEVWLRQQIAPGQHLRFSVLHLRHWNTDPFHAIEYRVSAGYAVQSKVVRAGTEAVWRPQRRALDERFWLNAYADSHWRKLRFRFDLRFNGDPADWFKRDTQCWLQVERSLW